MPDETSPPPDSIATHRPTSGQDKSTGVSPLQSANAERKATALKRSSSEETAKSPAKKSISYADAGVDITSGDRSKQRIKMLARKTFNKQVLSEIGGFGGLFALDLEKFPNPVLVSSADGVGTKLKVAFDLGIHHTVGQDLVNHCVNDIAVQGATPLFFLDYLATGKLEDIVIERVVQGISEACKANGCALIGGETAQMPGFYADGEYDLAGTIIGAVSRDKIITGEQIQIGDVLVGLPSNGLHTNGYSLARKLLFEVAKYGPEQYINELKDKTGAALMRTHRSYLSVIKKLTGADVVSGMAHITGGGITENLPRILPKGIGALVDRASWTVPPLFEHLQQLGNVEEDEMLRTFNMGIGLIAVIPAEKIKKAKAILNRANERHCLIGRIVRGERKVSYN
ncbi:phosphoribosylformylglycinamidine cyclo-ligase [Edaphobacter lichenicola]|uniref:Phosphoribosylformylglycinamidine cyclo-ligase n=1 Tax=Tunturiibacter gelidiferens TaxID=3069689 RepID=A0A9X0QAB1_9BACT|nr:phosphoribosylformylglycinamidine cyclo-ligase [Edaphobacter lichenicola]